MIHTSELPFYSAYKLLTASVVTWIMSSLMVSEQWACSIVSALQAGPQHTPAARHTDPAAVTRNQSEEWTVCIEVN